MHIATRLHAWTFLLGSLLSAPACAASVPPGEPVAPTAAEAPEAPIPVARLREDFDTLYAQLRASHYDLFARRSKAEYDALFERMRGALDTPLSRQEARLRFTRFVAFGRVAHARIDRPIERWAAFREGGGKALPLQLRVEGDEVFVLQQPGAAAGIAPGDRVLAIDGKPALAWLRSVGELVAADTDYMLYAQLEGLLPLLAWLASGEVEGVELTLLDAGGQPRKAWLPARTRAEVVAEEEARAGPTPPDMQARDARMLGNATAYLRPGPFYDTRPEAADPWDRSAFRSFIDAGFESFLDAGASDLLIDLRDNPGGDNAFSDLMLAWIADRPFRFSPAFDIRVSEATVAANRARLDSQSGDAGGASADLARLYAGQAPGTRVSYPIPLVPPREGRRFEGRVHVLVNRHSYSNAVSVAAIVQDYGFGRVLGEETSDLATTYGAMEHFTLPHTGLTVGYPKARIVRPSGALEARGVVPTMIIERPLVEGADDPVLRKALDVIREERMQRGNGGSA
ncbi:S41 family peptidase [Luteimonas kalidii]|uniref:S41 family peptidase n=1 Tax=Luteimonas kalidii TaxID=3042025 RepID=A0ABT6JSD1_9GAMM|nr:S41 family peptidase [Luteimonas kalidii]MDH5833590.1 S41 family peptidase [Luteimonas kalidii]